MSKTAVTVLAALLMWAASRADSPTPTGTFLQVVDGTLVKEADNSAVYIVDRGVLRHVTGGAFGKLYADFRGVVTVVTIPQHLVHQSLGNGTRLVRAKGDATVWLVDNGLTKRPVMSLVSFRRHGFAWSKVEVVRREEIEFLPVGSPLE